MNKLTEKLFAEGYTKDNYPDYVRWSSWQDFEYTPKFLKQSIWEAPCGLLKKGIHSYCHMSHLGVDYCPENDNPRLACPYINKECEHKIDTKFWGCNCVFHMTDKPYDYNISVERVQDIESEIQHKAFERLISENLHAASCRCLNWNRLAEKHEFRIIDISCLRCENKVCAATKKSRDTTKVNIVYDLHKWFKTKKGLIEDEWQEIRKGIKLYESVPKSGAEYYLKCNKEIRPSLNSIERQQEYFSEHHKTWGDYEYFECKITVKNVRIEPLRAKRDLMQDLQDIAEGIKVVHESDLQKAAAAAKRERKQKAKAKRIERLENLLRTVGYYNLDNLDKIRVDKAISKGDMEWIDFEEQKEPEFEQMEMNL